MRRAPRVEDSLPPLRLEELDDEAGLEGVAITGDVSGAVASHVELAGCRVSGARFTGAHLATLRVVDCVFRDCDLSGALLRGAALVRVAFQQCRLSGVVMHQGRWQDVHFADSKLDEANIRMTVGERVEFDDCVLHGTDFGGATLRPGARFFDCDLSRADFTKADVRGARLHGSVLDGLRGADSLTGTVIDPNQAVPLGLLLLAGRAVTVDEEREPGVTR